MKKSNKNFFTAFRKWTTALVMMAGSFVATALLGNFDSFLVWVVPAAFGGAALYALINPLSSIFGLSTEAGVALFLAICFATAVSAASISLKAVS